MADNKSCFIYKKPGCRSWNHTPEEQKAEKERFRTRNLHRFNTGSRDFDKKFHATYLQHVADVEDKAGDSDKNSKDEASKDKLSNAFETLLVDTDDLKKRDKDDIKKHSSSL